MQTKKEFPKDFMWGVSTASYQIEGNISNNWTEWEKNNIPQNVKRAYKSLHKSKHWDTIKNECLNPNNYICGKATNHFELYKTDIDLIGEMKLNSYRFSFEWARIEPKKGEFSHEGLEFYLRLVEYMQSKNITPFATIWHFTLPVWLYNEGGVMAPDFVKYFSRYAEFLAKNFKTKITHWITINEPEVYTTTAYLNGERPPCKHNLLTAIRCYSKLIETHKLLYGILKNINPFFQVGICKNNTVFIPYRNLYYNRFICYALDVLSNKWFLNSTMNYLDFIGLNFYYQCRLNLFVINNSNSRLSDNLWPLNPKYVFTTLMSLKKYNKPVYITENGIADYQDNKRRWYIPEVIKWCHKSIEKGLDLRGYFHWTLVDNFEWDAGYFPKFGLASFDRKTFKRKLRASGEVYKQIAQNNFILSD